MLEQVLAHCKISRHLPLQIDCNTTNPHDAVPELRFDPVTPQIQSSNIYSAFLCLEAQLTTESLSQSSNLPDNTAMGGGTDRGY